MNRIVITVHIPQEARKVARLLEVVGELWPDSNLRDERDDTWRVEIPANE